MPVSGLISHFGPARIQGWARCVSGPGEPPEPMNIELRFSGMESIPPTATSQRASDGATEFDFRLPQELQQLPWQVFIDRFECVLAMRAAASADRSALPLSKSVLGALDPNNATALLAERRREYSLGPKPDGRIAALTIAYNEHRMLPLWAKYYAGIVGAENTFILDQGSDKPYTDLPEGVTVVRLPRESFDNWLIMRLVATFQRHLLESYDSVLYADSDEFLCVAPDALRGQTLKSFLLGLQEPIGITRGYNLIHDIEHEHAIDTAKPILEQRKYIMRTTSMDKPMISRVPLNWVPGFHTAREGGVVIPGMYMLHLRWYDLDEALAKGNFYRNSKWNPYDVQTNTAAYQRDSSDEIVNLFRGRAHICGNIASNEFDPDAENTIVPQWMRESVII
jgi:hypothetical protein